MSSGISPRGRAMLLPYIRAIVLPPVPSGEVIINSYVARGVISTGVRKVISDTPFVSQEEETVTWPASTPFLSTTATFNRAVFVLSYVAVRRDKLRSLSASAVNA